MNVLMNVLMDVKSPMMQICPVEYTRNGIARVFHRADGSYNWLGQWVLHFISPLCLESYFELAFINNLLSDCWFPDC